MKRMMRREMKVTLSRDDMKKVLSLEYLERDPLQMKELADPSIGHDNLEEVVTTTD